MFAFWTKISQHDDCACLNMVILTVFPVIFKCQITDLAEVKEF